VVSGRKGRRVLLKSYPAMNFVLCFSAEVSRYSGRLSGRVRAADAAISPCSVASHHLSSSRDFNFELSDLLVFEEGNWPLGRKGGSIEFG